MLDYPKVTTSAPSFLFVQSPKEYNNTTNIRKRKKKAQCKCLISGSSPKKQSLDLPSEIKYIMWFDWSWRYREAGKRAGKPGEILAVSGGMSQVKLNATVEHLRSLDLLDSTYC